MSKSNRYWELFEKIAKRLSLEKIFRLIVARIGKVKFYCIWCKQVCIHLYSGVFSPLNKNHCFLIKFLPTSVITSRFLHIKPLTTMFCQDFDNNTDRLSWSRFSLKSDPWSTCSFLSKQARRSIFLQMVFSPASDWNYSTDIKRCERLSFFDRCHNLFCSGKKWIKSEPNIIKRLELLAEVLWSPLVIVFVMVDV